MPYLSNSRVAGTVKKYLRRAQRKIVPRRGKASLILVYHRVAEPVADPWSLCVSPKRFADQLAVLKTIADVVSLDTIVGARSDADLPSRPVAITFDDGYADVFHNAVPVLDGLKAPATMFVTTGYLDTEGEVWSDELARLVLLSDQDPLRLVEILGLPIRRNFDLQKEAEPWRAWEAPRNLHQWIYRELYDRLLDAAENRRADVLAVVRSWCGSRPYSVSPARFLTSDELIRMASNPWVQIGAHTVSHPVLAKIRQEKQAQEVTSSRRSLQKLTGKGVQTFAYPYGKKNHFNADTISAIRSAGFHCGCANYGRPVTRTTSRWALPRYQVLNWQADFFAREITRWYQD